MLRLDEKKSICRSSNGFWLNKSNTHTHTQTERALWERNIRFKFEFNPRGNWEKPTTLQRIKMKKRKHTRTNALHKSWLTPSLTHPLVQFTYIYVMTDYLRIESVDFVMIHRNCSATLPLALPLPLLPMIAFACLFVVAAAAVAAFVRMMCPK